MIILNKFENDNFIDFIQSCMQAILNFLVTYLLHGIHQCVKFFYVNCEQKVSRKFLNSLLQLDDSNTIHFISDWILNWVIGC